LVGDFLSFFVSSSVGGMNLTDELDCYVFAVSCLCRSLPDLSLLQSAFGDEMATPYGSFSGLFIEKSSFRTGLPCFRAQTMTNSICFLISKKALNPSSHIFYSGLVFALNTNFREVVCRNMRFGTSSKSLTFCFESSGALQLKRSDS